MSEQPQGAVDPLSVDWQRDIDALAARGPRARGALVRIADRADWRGRVLALSALGLLVRRDPSAHRPSARALLARLPFVRRSVPVTGWRGRLVSPSLVNATTDPSFIVRTAAALALGECRDPALDRVLAAMLSDPFRPVRAAAASARRACSGHAVAMETIDAAPEKTPALIGDGVPTLAWLQELSRAHDAVLRETLGERYRSGPPEPMSAAEWLAGPLASYGQGGAGAEAERYEGESDLAYQMAKPFGDRDRADNIRQLDAFIALVSQLDLPRGARVVDLGGGSGWAGELLARFGFRPLVVDVSPALLALARRRLTSGGLDGSVVSADMTALPLRSGSVDAVLAIDALHHVERLEEVFAEVRRVLVRGGPFLVAEPGEGHSESAKSLAETHEQGVRESEIHPRAIAALARRAGFEHVALLPRVPTRTEMQVGELRSAVTSRTAKWRVVADGTATEFDTLVLRTMLARPLMVMRAGQRAADSRAPGTLRAEIRPSLIREGSRLSGHVDLRNSGDTVWLHRADERGVGVVWVGLQLLDREGRLVNRELGRTALRRDVGPGSSDRVAIDVELPDATTPCRIKVDLVAEQVCWFEDRGSRAVYVDV